MKRKSFTSLVFGVGAFACFLLLAQAKTRGGYSPFTLGLFVALVYSRKNFFTVAALYVLSEFVVDSELETLVLSAVPVAVFAGVYFIHYKLQKSVGLLTVNLLAFFSQIPSVLLSLMRGEVLFTVLTNVLLTQMFTLCAVVAGYAVLVRGLNAKFTLDEMICTAVVSSVMALGLFSVSAFGIKPFFAVASFCILVMTYSLGSIGLVASVAFGVGAAFGGDFSAFAPLVFGGVCTLAFRTVSPYLAGLSFAASSIGLGLYFGGEVNFGLNECLTVLLGVIVFCSLPKGAKEKLGALLLAFREPHGDRHIVNRNRVAIARRLSSVAKVFWDLSSLVSDSAYILQDEERVEIVTAEVERAFCGDCPKRDNCERILEGKTHEVLRPVIEVAVRRGRATLLELPAFITGSCIKVNELIPLVNEIRDRHINTQKARNVANSGKIIFAEQLIGVGELLSAMSVDIRQVVGFDYPRERRLIDELAYINILCSEAIIEEDGETVTLVVREGESRKRGIERVVSRVMHQQMSGKVEKSRKNGDFDTITLTKSPKYDLIFGEGVAVKRGSEKSGDSRLVVRPSVDTYIMGIADGMGSGEKAEKNSRTAMSLVESFYKAGFSHKTVINLVNKMLTYSNDDGYNTLDMCILNTREGKCDFIKMGASPSYLKRGDRVEVLESNALPMGVLREVSPSIYEKDIASGDMLVLVSDGVTDAIGEEMLVGFLQNSTTPNPQELARIIQEMATKRGGGLDDVSVVVGRVL